MLLYGCALGAFIAPFATKKIRIKTVSLVVLAGTLVFWVLLYALFTVNISWLLLVLVAFLFGFCLQASWPLALYCQETEQGVSQANIGVSASLYISVSNIGAALLPVLFPLLFPAQLSTVVAVLAGLIITFVLWAVIKRKP